MDLLTFYSSGLELSLSQVAKDKELTVDIQKVLIWSGLLSNDSENGHATKTDGKFGLLTTRAFEKYQHFTNCPKVGIMDKATAQVLIDNPTSKSFVLRLKPGNDLAGRVIKYMLANSYNISYRPDTYNIVYLEGVNLDGTENDDEINIFNDLRMVIQIDTMGVPKIVGKWEANTEPGIQATSNRLNPMGAARIKFGQYKAWRVGCHNPGGSNQFPSLLQEEDISVFRDDNEDGLRTGDKLDTGLFSIDQHHANDSPVGDVGSFGHGTLVGRTESGHMEFMGTIMQDIRYKCNEGYLFETTIIAGDIFNKMFPAPT
jgi:hypothetical protein